MARQTRNSLASAEFTVLNQVPATSGPSGVQSQATITDSNWNASALSPAILAAIQSAATEAALAAVRASSSASLAIPGSSASSVAVQSDLHSHATAFMSAGGALSGNSSLATSGTQGRSVVPSFINTFTSSLSDPVISTAPRLATTVSSANAPGGSITATLDQPFVVGPGFSPIPYKLVQQITTGKYVDLSDLMASNLVQIESEPQLLLDGRVILTTSNKRNRRRIEDIVSWVEAFSIYSLVLASYFPHRWRDLNAYKLLILRTYRQLSGRVWLDYDKAFREHAAAIELIDWSSIDIQLFNFHAAGASARISRQDNPGAPEPNGSKSSDIICRSWNRGRCTAPGSKCKYAHICIACDGAHQRLDCPKSSRSKACSRSISPEPPRDKYSRM